MNFHIVCQRQSHRALMEHLRARACKQQHIAVIYLVKPPRRAHYARVCGVYPVHIRIYLAALRVKCCRECDRRRVGAAASEGSYFTPCVNALKAADYGYLPALHRLGKLKRRY